MGQTGQGSVGIGRVLASRSAARSSSAKFRIALAELDSGAGYLSYLVNEANSAQTYFYFDLVYLPVPSGTIRTSDNAATEPPRLFLPRIDDFLRPLPRQLAVDMVCILTRCLIGGFRLDGTIFGNHFCAALTNEPKVFAVSTYQMRGYADKAGVSFLKSILFLCIGMILVGQTRLDFHDDTVGCPLDRCERSRDEIVEGLKRMRFDHEPCRREIDADMRDAIDSLLSLPLSGHHKTI